MPWEGLRADPSRTSGPRVPLARLEGQEDVWQWGPGRHPWTCGAHAGRQAVLTSVADFIRLRSLTGVEFM